jgi:hypothetical protein
MHQLMIALTFVVTMAAPAVFAVRYATRPKHQAALVPAPSGRQFLSSTEGSVAAPVRVSVPAPKNKWATTPADDLKVDETIHRLILMQ